MKHLNHCNTYFTSTSQHQMACPAYKNSTILSHHSWVNKCKMSIQMLDSTLTALSTNLYILAQMARYLQYQRNKIKSHHFKCNVFNSYKLLQWCQIQKKICESKKRNKPSVDHQQLSRHPWLVFDCCRSQEPLLARSPSSSSPMSAWLAPADTQNTAFSCIYHDWLNSSNTLTHIHRFNSKYNVNVGQLAACLVLFSICSGAMHPLGKGQKLSYPADIITTSHAQMCSV